MQGFGGSPYIAIEIDGSSNNKILSSRIGTSLPGNTDGTANFTGISIINGATGNFVGDGNGLHGNVIGNSSFGIRINGSNGNTITGNHIGIGLNGDSDVGNSIGIDVFNSSGTIIGIAGDHTNLISYNSSQGIRLQGATNTSIANNYIGIDQTGLLDRGNGTGIEVYSASDLRFDQKDQVFDVSHLPQGIYFISIDERVMRKQGDLF